MKRIIIKKALPHQAFEIRKILRTTWIDTYPSEKLGITVEDIESKNFLSKAKVEKYEKMIREDKSQNMFIAMSGSAILGVCQTKVENYKGFIKVLYVLPEFQKQGIGAKLMNDALETLKDCKEISVELAAHNNKAYNFYSKYGFKKTGERGVYNLPSGKSFETIIMSRKN